MSTLFDNIPYIVGVDPSVAKTGVSTCAPDGTWSTHFIDTPNGAKDPGRIHWIAQQVLSLVDDGTYDVPECLLVIEKPMQSRGDPINMVLHMRIREELAKRCSVRTLVVSPAEVKKFATNDGRAEKGTVAFAVARKWGDILPDDAKEDTIESLVMAKIGECWLNRDEDGRWTEYEIDTAMLRKRKSGQREAVDDSATFEIG
jgi:Holliday junction resolvasome RuvABC endonuclease subunit